MLEKPGVILGTVDIGPNSLIHSSSFSYWGYWQAVWHFGKSLGFELGQGLDSTLNSVSITVNEPLSVFICKWDNNTDPTRLL